MIQQAKTAYDKGYVHLMRDHPGLSYMRTHTIEANFTAANYTACKLTFFVVCTCLMYILSFQH